MKAAYSIAETARELAKGRTPDGGRSGVYELIGKGLLDARKDGAHTIVTGESIARYVESQPKFVSKAGRGVRGRPSRQGVAARA